MKHPLKKEFKITQYFNENPDTYKKWGYRGHNGCDFGCPGGTPVFASIDGKVTEVAFDAEGYGKYVKIENDQYGSLVAHLIHTDVSIQEKVVEGFTRLGLSGNTGFSTGPHLHWGVFPKPRDRNNGYGGYVNPLPLLEGEEVEEMDRRETITEIHRAMFRRDPTKSELDRWDQSQKATSVTVAELWSSLEIDKKLESLTTQVSKLEQTTGGLQESVNTRLGSLADSIGQLTTQLETERKVISETSSKTDKTQEMATDLIKSDTQQEGLLQGIGERLLIAERAIKDLILELKKETSDKEVINVDIKKVYDGLPKEVKVSIFIAASFGIQEIIRALSGAEFNSALGTALANIALVFLTESKKRLDARK